MMPATMSPAGLGTETVVITYEISRFGQATQSTAQSNQCSSAYTLDKPAAEEMLTRLARATCHKHNLAFVKFSCIQKKFLTHYRCVNCGLVPLYQINLSHVKRVRCGKCKELIAYNSRGKYGRLRKELARDIFKEISGAMQHDI